MRGFPGTYMAVFLCLLLLAQPVDAQEAVFDVNGVAREVVVDQRVRTIMLYREGWESSYPILTFSEELPLVLEFDELSDEVGDFYYTVLHCDADWIPSELLPQEYIDGYDENRIEDYENSFNTYTNYTHFRLTLPNNDMRLTRSGNYLLVVFRDGDREEVVFSRRFLLSEAAVTIDAQVNRPVMSSFRDCCHEIDLVIRHGGYRIDDPFNETTLSIYQNGVWDNAIHDLQPRFINPGELVYDYQRENVFNAGNEFRMFDTRNTRVRAYHISNIEFISSTMHYELKEDAPNPPHLYFDREDMNGRYHIGNAEGRDPSVDADYGFVHFTLQSPFEMANGDIYITGALTNWQFTESNRMKFDEEAAAYRGTLFLKQGLYNYRYIFLPDDTSTFDLSEIEGSHYETKNDYVILFYHRPMGERYDRLVGHQVARSGS